MGLDSPTHLAEELPQPKRTLPQILIVVILSQFVVGVVWILVLGFSITDLDAILATSTGYVVCVRHSFILTIIQGSDR